jgi:hypothetical protein
MCPETETIGSVEQPEQEDLKIKAEEIAQKYQFESFDDHFYASNFPELNKFYLAMLDEYVSRSGCELPNGAELNLLDFGSGFMQYYDAYKTFFEKFGMPEGAKRNLAIVMWEADRKIPNAWADGIIGRMYEYLDEQSRDLSIKELESFFEKRENQKVDILTMFSMGPGSTLADPKAVDKSFQDVVSMLSSVLSDQGIIIATTSFGGAKINGFLQALENNGFEIKLRAPNKYNNIMSEERAPFSNDEIIIAQKKKQQN